MRNIRAAFSPSWRMRLSPILATDDDGKSWLPLGPGLRAEQMLRVYASPDGWWASIAHGGLMRYDAVKKVWQRAGMVTGGAATRLLRQAAIAAVLRVPTRRARQARDTTAPADV